MHFRFAVNPVVLLFRLLLLQRTLHYVGTPVHRVVPDFVIQMGDVMNKDGTGGKIYAYTYVTLCL